MRSWQWIGGITKGTRQKPGESLTQDAGACIEVLGPNTRSALVLVVSDGAGSAAAARQGAHAVVRGMCSALKQYKLAGGTASHLTDQIFLEWLNGIRSKIKSIADSRCLSLCDFAATLISAFIDDTGHYICQIGDGACVVKYDSRWNCPIWPMNGRYINETFFVTDLPSPKIRFHYGKENVNSIFLFSDGIQELILDEKNRCPHDSFFEEIISKMKQSESFGRDRFLSDKLRKWLFSKEIADRSDDDKTLIAARLLQEAPRVSALRVE